MRGSLDENAIAGLTDLFIRSVICPNRVISGHMFPILVGLSKAAGLDPAAFNMHMTCLEAWNLVDENVLYVLVMRE